MAGSNKSGRKPKASTIVDKLRERDSISDDRKPPCPEWLSLEAKRIWKREASALHKAGLLTYVDGLAFANYCLISAQLKQAYSELGDKLTYEYTNKNGSTNEVPKPQVAIIHKCVEQLKSLSAEFGMTPASRSRIPHQEKEKQKHKPIALVSADPRDLLESK